jgi:hypothetical protein
MKYINFEVYIVFLFFEGIDSKDVLLFLSNILHLGIHPWNSEKKIICWMPPMP